MKFGPTPVTEATGAVLAHSVAVPGGRLRKGHVLSADDCAALQAGGTSDVIVARLEEGDIGENAAADALADALWQNHSGLRRTEPFTGRVNLLADGPGVAMLDVAALDAVNAIDAMITVATVPPFQQMQPGGMVATIKIISYAVPYHALARACAAGRGAVALSAPRLLGATLIVTEIKGGAGDKGRDAIAARLDALGITLEAVLHVPHDQAALADALTQSQSPLVLILTASATSDRADVAPAALQAAGGRLERFGMPVDPGNLLFVGSLGDRQVIGLPGCARSPALNGADWVLSRVACGVPVTDRDIARMGVGGLLKEIPSRPQPRTRAPKAPES